MSGIDLLKGNIIWIILGSIFFYIAFILFSDVNEISEQFLQIRIELVFLVFLFGIISHIVKSIRQKEFLQTLDEKISFKHNLFIYFAGMSMISTPGGIGVFIKSYFLHRQLKIDNNKSLAVIFLEKYHDLLATTSIIVFSFAISFSWISITLVIISCFLLVGVYLAITNVNVFYFFHKKLLAVEFLKKRLSKITPNESFLILSRPKVMTKGWLISIVGWSLDAFAVYVGFLAFNVDLGYLLTSQIYFTSLGYGILSFIPGGIGVTEGMADYLLVKQGLSLALASSLVIFTRLTTMWFVTAIGIIFTQQALKKKIMS